MTPSPSCWFAGLSMPWASGSGSISAGSRVHQISCSRSGAPRSSSTAVSGTDITAAARRRHRLRMWASGLPSSRPTWLGISASSMPWRPWAGGLRWSGNVPCRHPVRHPPWAVLSISSETARPTGSTSVEPARGDVGPSVRGDRSAPRPGSSAAVDEMGTRLGVMFQRDQIASRHVSTVSTQDLDPNSTGSSDERMCSKTMNVETRSPATVIDN